jgi:hypothetical protein
VGSYRAFSAANLLTLFLYGAVSATFFLLPFTLVQGYEYSATLTGAVFLPFALVMGILIAYMILGVQFNSFVHPFTVLLAMPFAVTGALSLAGTHEFWAHHIALKAVVFAGVIVIGTMIDPAARDFGPALQDIVANGEDPDPQLLHHCLINLIDNASRYSGAGGPVRIVGANVRGDVKLTIEDEGPGLPVERERALDVGLRAEAIASYAAHEPLLDSLGWTPSEP